MATLPPTTTRYSGSLRRRCLLLLILLSVAGTATAAGTLVWARYRARQERAEALQAAHSGRFSEAEPLLRRALERDHDDLDAVKALALGHLGAGQLAQAEPYLSRWCELRPDDAEPFKQRMEVGHRRARAATNAAEQQRLMEDAVANGQRALQLDPTDDPVAQEVVWLLLQVCRFDDADKLCRDCLRRQPDDPWLTYLHAKISHGRENLGEARTLLDTLLKREARFTPALLLRAVLYNEAGEPAKAVPLLRQVLALDRDDPKEARYQLSLALARTGQAEEAQRLMAEVQRDNLNRLLAATHNPDAPAVKLQRAEIYLAGDREEEALRLLAPLLEHDPGSAAAHALLADYYEHKGQPERAAEHRRRAEDPRLRSRDR
jgi:tetratricopeptide (TPR) repeat protein